MCQSARWMCTAALMPPSTATALLNAPRAPQAAAEVRSLPTADLSTTVGSTVGRRNVGGQPSPDALFTFELADPALVWLSLCHAETDFDTYLSVWRGCAPGVEIVAHVLEGLGCLASGLAVPML